METKTEEKTTTPALEVPGAANLASRRIGTTAVSPWQSMDWTPERKALLQKQLCPPTATALEFEYYFDWCRQTGLNPFVKQCYLIERWDTVSNTKRHEPMVAEAGFAARADALPDFRGMKSGVVYAGDIFGIDEEAGKVVHEWDLATRAKAGNKVLGAWAQGFRDGRVCEITWLTLETRIQMKKATAQGPAAPTIFWARDSPGQIRKCARADQYRRLYPNIFAGWYEPAEAREEEMEVNPAPTAAPAKPTGKSDALKDRLKRAAAQTVDAKAETKADTKPTSKAPPIDCVRFGPHKGTLISDVSTIDLEAAISEANRGLANATGKEPWVQSVKEGIAAITAELERREANPPSVDDVLPRDENEPQPEPGSNG